MWTGISHTYSVTIGHVSLPVPTAPPQNSVTILCRQSAINACTFDTFSLQKKNEVTARCGCLVHVVSGAAMMTVLGAQRSRLNRGESVFVAARAFNSAAGHKTVNTVDIFLFTLDQRSFRRSGEYSSIFTNRE
jgi:hypothetical protein